MARLIDQQIDSVHRLETLLHLRRDPERRWSEEELQNELRTTRDAVVTSLSELATRGFIEASADNPRTYRYHPATEELARAVDGLAEAYATYRVAVIEQIYAKPHEKVRTFADAFRLRKDD